MRLERMINNDIIKSISIGINSPIDIFVSLMGSNQNVKREILRNKIYSFIKLNPNAYLSDVAESLDIDVRVVIRETKYLAEKGFIEI